MTWTTQYEANELPESATPAWTSSYNPEPLVSSTVEISPAGKLHIIGEGGESIMWTITEGLPSASGITIEFSMQMVSGDVKANDTSDCSIAIENDDYGCAFDIYTDGIEDNTTNTLIHAMDTTDGYHTYRLTLSGDTANLYIDNVLVGPVTTYETEGSTFYFTASQGAVNSETNWDYIYYSTEGAFAPVVDWDFKSLNELERSALETATGLSGMSLNDLRLAYYNSELSASHISVQDAQRAWLQLQTSSTVSSIPDLWRIYLTEVKSIPEQISLNDMLVTLYKDVGL